MNLDSAKRLATEVFSDTYHEARQKFLEAAPSSKAYACSTKGPGGEALFTDAVYIGAPNAKKLLILISGTHGVEGYCGSAAQLLFLKAGFHKRLASEIAVLFVHALNCFGFAWDRRVTAEGCDLNRNFIDFSKPIPANPGYEELAEHLVPADLSPEGLRRAEAAISEYRSRHGEWSFQAMRKSGQYTRPGGMFYGGTGPTEARFTLEQITRDFDVFQRDEVVVLDYHTGLGPYGYCELQCEDVSGMDGYERAVRIFGPSVTSNLVGNSTSPLLHGTQAEYWQRALGGRQTYVCPEFGTYEPDRSRKAFRDDLWLFLHRPDAADSELGRKIRAATKAHFYPQAADWKEMVVWRSHQVSRQAIEALSSAD
ncbi:M14 family metallopeptidase [Bradyrhizobium zhanjiangense]|uniref:DUF2817 domain-containing protein n=1 Tax=Bradyrhizobium zhanjiangense TaxID=1325107 RepID=A0A4Q0SKX4_9BRAD|nr:M14 family metallopeptidase [Bradyrhizobium zhanjiangense]RXH40395.1 hypothetical protein XH94_13275 [Bradyrhizobium zhanjiangense]